MKSLLIVAGALLATSALIATARADQQIPARQTYAPPAASPPAYQPQNAYAPAPQWTAPGWNDSTVPAKIGSPKQP